MSRRVTIRMALAVLLLAHIVPLLAGFFAPYDPARQYRDFPYAPPMRLHIIDSTGHWHLRPFVYAWTPSPEEFGQYLEDRSRGYSLHLFVPGPEYQLGGFLHAHIHLVGVDTPGQFFLLGTDGYGRDILSRLIYGGRISLFAGLLATALSLGAGLLIGVVAGYYGGFADDALMRLAELFLAMPWLYLLLAVRAFMPLRITPEQAFLLVVIVVGAVGWARPARLIRGVVLSAKERNYVLAARGFGASGVYLMRKHILPQAWGVMLTQAALLIPQYILAELTLSFFGLGVGEPVPSWGNMLAALQQYSVLSNYWWMLAPALVLIPVTWAYYVLASRLNQRLQA